MEIKTIKIDNIMFGTNDMRKHDSKADYVTEKMGDLELRGLLNVFAVVPTDEEGVYSIVDGAIRLTALKRYFKENGRLPAKISDDDTIPVQIREKQEDIKTLMDQVAGNASTTKTANKEYIDALYQISQSGEFTNAEIAKNCGMSEGYFNTILKTLKLGDDTLTLAQEKKVSMANLITLATIAKLVSEDDMVELVDQASTTTAALFAAAINDKVTAIRTAAKDGVEKIEGYVHMPRLLKKDELHMLFVQCQGAFDTDPSPVNEARNQLMKEIWQSDEVAEAKGRDNYEQKKADQAAKKEERAKLREEAKLGEMKEKLVGEGYKVSKKM